MDRRSQRRAGSGIDRARVRRSGHGDGRLLGSDPAPTLAQLQEYVRTGQLRYILIGGGGPGGGFGGGGSSSIASWVAANGTVVNISGGFGTLYDLAAAK